jgi:hypothetical protein
MTVKVNKKLRVKSSDKVKRIDGVYNRAKEKDVLRRLKNGDYNGY